MHSTLHGLFKSNKFKYGSVIEPNGNNWIQLKGILQTLDPASFATVWKCIIHARYFLSRAFNDSAIKSAFEKAGLFVAAKSGSFCPNTILSQCAHWKNLSTDYSQWLLDQLPRFYDHFKRDFYLKEEVFSILAERNGIDNSPELRGKELNDLVTNRQRCLILGNNNFRVHQQMREEERMRERSQRSNTIKCYACLRDINNQAGVWKCNVKYCRHRCCGSDACSRMLETHQNFHQVKIAEV